MAANGVHDIFAANAPPQCTQFLKVPQEPTKRRKVSVEPIINYTQSQILTSHEYVDALESMVEKKFRIAQEKEERRQRELTKKAKEIAVEKKKKRKKASTKLAKDKEAKKKDLERKKK